MNKDGDIYEVVIENAWPPMKFRFSYMEHATEFLGLAHTGYVKEDVDTDMDKVEFVLRIVGKDNE